MNDSVRQPRARGNADAQAEAQEAAQPQARTDAPADKGLVQLADDQKVSILKDAMTALLARHKAMSTDPAFVDAQRALNVVTYGVKKA